MTDGLSVMCVLLFMASHFGVAVPHPPVGGDRSLAKHAFCREDLEYPVSPDICCLNCPAGEHMTSPCTKSGESSSCAPCASGTFTEHRNGLPSCLTCTKCRSDQETVRDCTSTQDAVCQCKPGYFCIRDQVCEVCKKCKRCEHGEVTLKNCTAVANTECSKGLPTPTAPAAWVTPLAVVAAVTTIGGFAILVYKKRRHWMPYLQSHSSEDSPVYAAGHGSLEDRQNAQNVSVAFPLLRTEETSPQAFNDDNVDLGLGESSSENSLCVQNTLCPFPTDSPVIPNQASPRTLCQPCPRNDEDPELVPVNGEQSLRNCFEYFYDMDYCYIRRFFRSLDVSDNVIRNAERQLPEAAYELLVHWQEKEGREANLNHLLKKLRALKQNRLAEEIMAKAVHNGHYKLQVEE